MLPMGTKSATLLTSEAHFEGLADVTLVEKVKG